MTALPPRSPSAERSADAVARQVQRADPRLPRIDAEIGKVDDPYAAGSRLSSTPHRGYRALLTSRDALARRLAAVQLARLSRPAAAPESSASDGRLVALMGAEVGFLRRRVNGDLEGRCPGGCGCGSEHAASQRRLAAGERRARLTQRSCAHFGRGELRNGRAAVQLDRDFAGVARTEDYHVFLTPEGDSQGLYVSRRNPTGFEVREQQGGRSRVAFSYRVVAKRKDVDARRLDKVTLAPPLEVDDLPSIEFEEQPPGAPKVPAGPAEPSPPSPPPGVPKPSEVAELSG